MAIIIKTQDNINKMRESGKIVARTFEKLGGYIKPGITTLELDKIAEDVILSYDAKASFKGYNGFPGSICVSINEEIIHGIPSSNRKLVDGDIVGIDIGAFKNGFHGDAARTFCVGSVSDEARLLVERTEQSFFEGIKYANINHRLFEISEAVYRYISQFGYTAVEEFGGHGIGKKLHEDPHIPHFPQKGRGPRLTKSMVICIEPMINLGKRDIFILDDKWTVVTKDKQLSAHYENTVLITDGEPELLTI